MEPTRSWENLPRTSQEGHLERPRQFQDDLGTFPQEVIFCGGWKLEAESMMVTSRKTAGRWKGRSEKHLDVGDETPHRADIIHADQHRDLGKAVMREIQWI